MTKPTKTTNRIPEAKAKPKPKPDTPPEPSANGQANGKAHASDAPATAAPPDPYDDVRCATALGTGLTDLGVEDDQDEIAVRRPSKEEFIRTHPDQAYRREVRLIVLKESDRGVYWVDPSLWGELADEPTMKRVNLITTVNNLDQVFLWPVAVHEQLDREAPTWITVPTKVAKRAEEFWTQMYWDERQRRHRRRTAKRLTKEPRWPALSMTELIRLAFADRTILSVTHATIQRLREGVVQEVADDDDD